jgi:hypothetical protein
MAGKPAVSEPRAVRSADPASGPKPSASVVLPWLVKRNRAVCTRFPAAVVRYLWSSRPSRRSVQPSLVPRKPLEVAPNAGDPTSALAALASLATSASPMVLPASSLRELDSAGS